MSAETLSLPISAGVNSVAIENLSEEIALTDNDYLIMLDIGSGVNKKIKKSNFQATSAILSSIENLLYTGDEILYSVSNTAFGTSKTTATSRTLLTKTSIFDMQSYLGLRPNSDVQTYSSGLSSLSNTISTGATGDIFYKNSSGTISATNTSSYVRSNLLNKTSANEIATLISAVSYSSAVDNRLTRFDGTDGTIKSSNVTLDNSGNLSGITNLTLTGTLNNITIDELSQLENIGATTVSAIQWGYLGSLDQALNTTSDTTFNSVSTSGLNMNSNKITNVANPTNANDVANKTYVDDLLGTGINALEEARCATVSALSANYTAVGRGRLTAVANGAISIDGVSLELADRVLVKNQSTTTHNGVYVVIVIGDEATPYQLERSLDFYSSVQPISNAFVFITEGTTNINSGWLLQGTVELIDTDVVSFTKFSASLNAGDALNITGGAYNVAYDDTTIGVNGSDQLAIKAPVDIAYGGTGAISFSAGSRLIASNSSNTALETTSLDPSLVVDLSTGQTLTNKTINSSTNTITADALHDKVGSKVSINNTASALTEYLKVTSLAPLQAEWTNIAGLDANGVDIHGTTAETTNDNADEILIYDTTAGANRRMTRANFLTGISVDFPQGTANAILLVSQDGRGDYTTISSAISAASAGASIFVYPGTYAENITISNNIKIHGFLFGQQVIIAGSGTTARVTFTGSGILNSVTVQAPSSGTNPAIDATGLALSDMAVLENIIIHGTGGSNDGIKGAGAGTLTSTHDIRHCSGVLGGAVINCTGGTMTFSNVITKAGSSVDVINISGGSVKIEELLTHGSSSYSATDFVDISGGMLVLSNIVNRLSDTPFTNALHISGDGVIIDLNAGTLYGNTYDLLVDGGLTGTNTVLTGTTRLRNEKLSFPSTFLSNAQLELFYVDKGVEDDAGMRLIGDVSIGHPFDSHEISIGEGDSSTYQMRVFTFDGVSTYVDQTSAAKSRSSSSFDFFTDTTNGMVYIGSTARQFFGVKIDIATAKVGGQCTCQYWNGTAWTDCNACVTKADAPYTNYTYRRFEHTGGQQIRFDTSISADWSQVDVNGVTAYWVRSVITEPLTTSPVIERIKLHTNRTEINKDGFIEYFGSAQPSLYVYNFNEYDLSGASPSNSTISLSSNVGLIANDKRFSNNTVDGRVFGVFMPSAVDTSRPMEFIVNWYPDTNNAGDVELEVILVRDVASGINVNNQTLTETSQTVITSVNNSSGILQTSSFSFDIGLTTASTYKFLALRRDASGGNVVDTLVGDIVITTVYAKFIKWSN